MPLTPGARFGPYEVLSLIGAGGMGEVYKARDTRLGRDVAVKVIPEELAAHRDRLRRFEQEARATAALSHPNILALFDVGVEGDVERGIAHRLGADLERIVLDNYDANERKSRNRVLIAFRHLRPSFERTSAVFITGDRLERYVSQRREEGAKPATIQYEMAMLRRAFRLEVKSGRLPGVPSFPTISVKNARKGFLEEGDFERVMGHLPEDVRPLVQFLWLTGWRKGEALGLQWRSVDVVSGTIRVEETKSGEPRTLPFHALPELDAPLHGLRKRRLELEREQDNIIPWVFHRENGHPVRDVRRAWVAATKAAGVPGRILHDFRRTAVRRMERAGVPRSVAMKISGHKTESVYRRYAIVAERGIADGLKKVAAFQRRVARAASGGQMGDSRVPSWVR